MDLLGSCWLLQLVELGGVPLMGWWQLVVVEVNEGLNGLLWKLVGSWLLLVTYTYENIFDQHICMK